VVAVIDCPVDYSHPDLAPVMWKNLNEIPGNGKDDDGNWYRDDVRGWFFNCSREGKTVDNEQPEATQIYQLFSRQFEGRDEKSITASERRDWISYHKAKQQFEKGREKARAFEAFFSDSIRLFSTLNDMMMQSEQPITPDQIDDWKVNDPVYGKAVKSVLKEIFLNRYKSLDGFMRKLRYELPELRREYQSLWKCDFNPDCFPRAIIQDHPENPNERMYGCGFLSDPASENNGHGTHVAGIIGAKRDNGTGIEGIANNVQIMSLSVVPSEGDERDKDVANSIRYAADNGAKIINMSFAKRFSPHKKAVDDAIRYAEGKGVLFFHAAGNYHLDRDTAVFYPERNFLSGSAGNWIEVGNNQLSLDENLAAPSSNYGKKSVDLFAPGTDILSTYPGGRYETMTGTSMACPVAAGVAALIWSYFPKLTASELKKILMESVYKPDLKVKKPGNTGLVPFSSLSKSGGIINAKNAVSTAELLSRKKRRK
jgi:subtilisin family serine protease